MSLILQDVGLLILDGIAFWASQSRLSSLLDAGVQFSVQARSEGCCADASVLMCRSEWQEETAM